MGKAPNGLGKFSGKVGGVVFAISNGEQIVRAYQPIVTNPKSEAQLLQRAKGNLVGQLSSFVPRSAIVGLGANNRRRRAEFLRNCLKNATAVKTGDDYVAKVQANDIKFSKGAVEPVIFINQITPTSYTTTVEITRLPNVTDEVAARSVATIVLLAINENGDYKACYVRSAPVPAQGSSTTFTIQHPNWGEFSVYGFVIPCEMVDGSGLSVQGLPINLDAADLAATLATSSYASQLSYGDSVMWATANYTPNAKEETKISDKNKKS